MYFSLYYVKINVTWFRIYLKRRSINLFPFKAIYITNNYTFVPIRNKLAPPHPPLSILIPFVSFFPFLFFFNPTPLLPCNHNRDARAIAHACSRVPLYLAHDADNAYEARYSRVW